MTSQSSLGAATIVIQFDLERSIDSAAQDVQAAITVANKQLPQSLTTPPAYKKVNPADVPILLISVHSDTVPIIDVDDYANIFLAQQIAQVSGVAQVLVYGDQTPSIRVQVDPFKLAANGITLEDIRGTLVTQTTNAAKGSINGDNISFMIAANDQIIDANKFNDVVLAYRNGAPIRVRDVGQAVAAPVDRTVVAYQNNKEGVILAIFKQPGANVIDIVDNIKAELPKLTARIPPAVKTDIILDRTKTIRASVDRRRVHTGADRLPRGDGHPFVPAKFLGNAHSERHCSVGAGRFVWRHVPHAFFHRQPVAHGADDRHRLRGR